MDTMAQPLRHTGMFAFEAAFDVPASIPIMDSIKHLSIVAALAYVIAVAAGRRYMSSRAPLSLRGPLIAWNVALAVFSVCGAYRTVPQLVRSMEGWAWTSSMCLDTSYYEGASGVWSFLFTVSKLFEFGDTAFIVLRKQPLQFLHWYHHATVMIYVFYNYPEKVAFCLWFMALNFSVHAAMYTYYALKALRVKVPRAVSVAITLAQILQMIVGLSVAVSVGVMKLRGAPCGQSYINVFLTLVMYVSYFVLFVRFFIHAYGGAPREGKGKAAESNDVSNGVKKNK